MKWEEVRNIYPNRFVKVQILESHIKDNIRYVDDMAVVKDFDNEIEATRELARTEDDFLVFHTGKNKIEVPIKHLFGYRGAI